MTPPEKLRVELQRLRDRGYPFRWAWPAAVNHALRCEHAPSAVFWRGVFNEQKLLWSTAYSRAPWPANQRPALSALDEDRSGPAARTARTPVLA